MTEPLHVLLVEDSALDAQLVQIELRRTGRTVITERVQDGAAMQAALDQRPWDLVISDWSMPGFNGAEALRILRSSGSEVPFLIVSGTVGEEAAVAAMRHGASDYIVKDKLSRLVPAVERALRESDERAALRRAEGQLAMQDTRHRALLEHSADIIAVTDADLRITYVSPAVVATLGYRPEDLVGRIGLEIVALAEQPRLIAQIAELRRLPRSRIVVVLPAPDRDGHVRWFEATVTNLLDEPAVLGLVWNVRDITERKQDLDVLLQAQKMESLGRLAGGVAHDFNNILSVILSYADMLSDQATDLAIEDLDEIRRAAMRAADLTRQLLVFSRQQVISPVVLDPAVVLADMDRMLRRIVGEDVTLRYLTRKDVARIRIDPGQLEQIVMNLVINARDAMPRGGDITIEMSLANLDEEFARRHPGVSSGSYVMLAFTDGGVGMDAATQTQIFEPFFTTKDKGKGTGLGLSTVFGIVRASGGAIEVDSGPDRGTTFRIYLPLVTADVEAAVIRPAPVHLGGTETILLVEDEIQVRTVAASILQRSGYHVLVAADPEDAIRIATTHPGPIDLLISDVVMPVLCGAELAGRLTVLRPAMKVLHISGYTDDSMARHGVIEGDVPFLPKPLTPDTLKRKVREVLETAVPDPST